MASSQEDLFSSTNCNGTVASNEDDAIELMMYRQNNSQSDVDPTLMSGSHGSLEPLPDELGPAERGEAPPLREVKLPVVRILTNISCVGFKRSNKLHQFVLLFQLQASAKFGENHRFCNIKVSKYTTQHQPMNRHSRTHSS